MGQVGKTLLYYFFIKLGHTLSYPSLVFDLSFILTFDICVSVSPNAFFAYFGYNKAQVAFLLLFFRTQLFWLLFSGERSPLWSFAKINLVGPPPSVLEPLPKNIF